MTEPLTAATEAHVLRCGRSLARSYPPGRESADEAMTYVRNLAWAELESALHGALNKTWSVGAESALEMLIRAMRVVGVSPIGTVSYSVVWSGLYDTVLTAADLTCPDSPKIANRVRATAERYMNTCPNPCRDDAHYLSILDVDGEMQWTVHVAQHALIRLAHTEGRTALRVVRDLARDSLRTKLITGFRRYVIVPPESMRVSSPSVIEWPSENEQ